MDRDTIVKINKSQYLDWIGCESRPNDKFIDAIKKVDVYSSIKLASLMLKVGGNREGSILDVGSGDCLKYNMLLDVLGGPYHGIEIQPELVEKHSRKGVTGMFLEDILDTDKKRVDYVYANHVIEHCLDPMITAKALHRAVFEDGVVGVSFPVLDNDTDEAHLNKLNIDGWKCIFEQVGFEVKFKFVEDVYKVAPILERLDYSPLPVFGFMVLKRSG